MTPTNRVADSDPDLLAGADALIRAHESGDAHASREMLRQVVAALDDIIGNEAETGRLPRLPGKERSRYLSAHRKSIEAVLAGIDARKALGTYGLLPRKRGALTLFIATGLELDRLEEKSPGMPGRVRLAQQLVAKRLIPETQTGKPKRGIETVRKAWEANGGLKEWRIGKSL